VSSLPHLEPLFPLLSAAGYEKTSNFTGMPPKPGAYNCIAWAAHDKDEWWWPAPSAYWPPWSARVSHIENFLSAFEGLGYRRCLSSAYEFGYEKVAIYAIHPSFAKQPVPTDFTVLSKWAVTHMARQLSDGSWTTKAGGAEDFTHFTLDAIEVYGPDGYGCPVLYMKRHLILGCCVRPAMWAYWKITRRNR
jgi:hypothetical protein